MVQGMHIMLETAVHFVETESDSDGFKLDYFTPCSRMAFRANFLYLSCEINRI